MQLHTIVLSCAGGVVALPAQPMNHRSEGGHLLVNPPRAVWERSELSLTELTQWSCLVAATGRAMLETLPQLAGGCVNYWEAGNNALNDLAPPQGPKVPQLHRNMHLHVFGRARQAEHPDWRWGEPPQFPKYAQSAAWAAQFTRLEPAECIALRLSIQGILGSQYGITEFK